MANLNKVFLMGNLTRDPELKYSPSGVAICSFSIAINREWLSNGEKKSEVCYVEIVAFGRRGEVINEYFTKGNPIFIEGRLQFSQWETKDGQKRSALKTVMENFQFIGSKMSQGGSGSTDKAGQQREENPFDINDEEIPF